MMPPLKVVGFDPSLRNWGYAKGIITLKGSDLILTLQDVGVIRPVLPKGKQTRQNSLDLASATELYIEAVKHAREAQLIFAEVPVGSQSARAMASYGICVGVLGSLRGENIPFFEVTPTEVKVALANDKNASKDTMISYALAKHPEVAWPTVKSKGLVNVTMGQAEHIADAIGAIYAGLRLNNTQQFLRAFNQQNI